MLTERGRCRSRTCNIDINRQRTGPEMNLKVRRLLHTVRASSGGCEQLRVWCVLQLSCQIRGKRGRVDRIVIKQHNELVVGGINRRAILDRGIPERSAAILA